MGGKHVTLEIRRCGMSANESTLHPSHKCVKSRSTAFNMEPWLTPNSKLLRAPK